MAENNEQTKDKESDENIKSMQRNLHVALDVLNNYSKCVVNWKDDMNRVIKLLEDTGNDRIDLCFVKDKMRDLNTKLEVELSKLRLEAYIT